LSRTRKFAEFPSIFDAENGPRNHDFRSAPGQQPKDELHKDVNTLGKLLLRKNNRSVRGRDDQNSSIAVNAKGLIPH